VQDVREHRPPVGDQDDVEVNQLVALALVVGGDARPGRELVAHMRYGKVRHLAAHVDPGRQRNVLAKDEVTQAQQLARMRQAFFGVDGIRFANIASILAAISEVSTKGVMPSDVPAARLVSSAAGRCSGGGRCA